MIRKLILTILAVAAPAYAQPQSWAWDDGTVPYVVTPMEIVERMLRMAEVGRDDYVIDLGSGDGRIIIEAARRGARGLGVDLDPNLVKAATENARRAGVGDRTRFEIMDLFDANLAPATVVTMYLLPDFNAKLQARLLRLKPGTRIVSHDGGIGDWPADETLEMRAPEKPVGVGGRSKIELWVVPADVAGIWMSELGEHGGAWRFRIAQKYQVLDIEAAAGGEHLLVRNSRLRGNEIKMVLTGKVRGRFWHQYFVGTVRGERIEGQLTASDGNLQRVFPWTAVRAR
ncbi:MAG TPA: class I SAM-dependent methyltransferase [Burkholderiales bacterium]